MDLTQKFDAQTSNSFRQALCGFDRVSKEGGWGEERGQRDSLRALFENQNGGRVHK